MSNHHSPSHLRELLALTALTAFASCGGGGQTSNNNSGPSPDPANPTAGGQDFQPAWAKTTPSEVLEFDYDTGKNDEANGTDLRIAIQSLTPGQRLEIGSGRYSINVRFDVSLLGTESAPIWIAAKSGATPIITRPNTSQNTINVGNSGGSRYLSFEGIEVTGGSAGFKLYSCAYVRIDNCEVHGTNGPGIAANSADTANLHITNNHVHDTAGAGEGMYLGANNSVWIMRDSVIALNHVHDTRGSQGDGIEVKQGSHGNLIAYNHVHDTNYPCIIAYGTDGNPRNVIEGNICYNSNEAVMQVQGEATVRNNLLINGDGGFLSTDHQGQTRELTFVHNTILTNGRGANLSSWNNRTGMVFANNVVYSQNSNSLRFPSGSNGVVVVGNIVVGSVSGVGSGFATGSGTSDFVGIAWDGSQRDATPTVDLIRSNADPLYAVTLDLNGATRTRTPAAAGCLD